MRSTYLGSLCKRGHASPEDPTKTRRNVNGGCRACLDYMSGATAAREKKAARQAEKEAELKAKLAARQARADEQRDRATHRERLADLTGLDLIRELLIYDPTTGSLTSRVNRGPLKKGKPVGWVHPKSFLRVAILNKQYAAHRLIYWMVTGTPPVYEVVALNGDKLDLRWSNLHQMSEEEQDAFDEWVMGVARKDPNGPAHPDVRQTTQEAEAGKRWPTQPAEQEEPMW